MPETDILNPTPTHPLNPDFGFQRKRPVTHVSPKARQGPPYFREMTDVGHQFILNWAERSTEAARELKRYYEQYVDGFFTLIDHEDGGRHYVGRFTSPVEPIPVSNVKWSVQYVTFDEVPGAPMKKYPSRWDHDSIWRLLQSDFGELKVCGLGAWTLTPNAQAKSGYIFENPGNLTDQAAMAYQGYGFQFWAPQLPGLGSADIYLDNVLVGTVNQQSAQAKASAALFTKDDIPLGTHIVSVQPHTANAPVIWDALKVMR